MPQKYDSVDDKPQLASFQCINIMHLFSQLNYLRRKKKVLPKLRNFLSHESLKTIKLILLFGKKDIIIVIIIYCTF